MLRRAHVAETHNHFEKDSNCQVFNGPVTGCVFAMPGATVTQVPAGKAAVAEPVSTVSDSVADDDADGLEERLKPLFFNNETDVGLFLKEISGMEPNSITDLVNKWVQDKRISDYGNSRKGDLWKILHEAGLYPRTVQNWNRRVY